MNFDERKKSIIEYSNQIAHKRDYWIKKNHSFYSDDRSFMNFLIESNLKILDIGCGTGDLLSSLKPKYGMGIDFSPNMIQIAKKRYPNFDFVQGDVEDKNFVAKINKKFDVIILSDVFGYFNDCQNTLNNLQHFCNFNTRIIIAYHSWFWEPILKTGAHRNVSRVRQCQLQMYHRAPTDRNACVKSATLATFHLVCHVLHALQEHTRR